MSTVHQCDVLVCGAGPVGLLVALGLEQQGISTCLIEKRERESQKLYGRAGGLYPRTLELLEQLDVIDDLEQMGFTARANANFNNGKRVVARGWQVVFEGLHNTFFNYMLNIRQKFSEDIFGEKYCGLGKKIHHGWQFKGFERIETPMDEYNIAANIEHSATGKGKIIKCKYLVGADGGQSGVREAAGIDMLREATTHQWIRIDGKMTTDMPDANIGSASIETEHHGNVLWVRMDHDSYRIGYAVTAELRAKYPQGLTQEQAIHEAIESLKPFSLSIDRVDWWTSYGVAQGVVTSMQNADYILLAGDAAHVHSSGFAQGMNTGVHDATNLIWKLAGAIKGWYKPSVLATYDSERRPVAQKLIDMDKLASAAISGAVPPEYQDLAATGASPDDIVTKIYSDNISFVSGLGISYAESSVNQEPTNGTVLAGHRAPDAMLSRPGRRTPIRLYDIIRAYGKWNIIVFAGYHTITRDALRQSRDKLFAGETGLVPRRSAVLNLSTIIAGTVNSAWEAFGGPAVGRFYLDPHGDAHSSYGVSLGSGGVAVIRPDGIHGFAAGLHEAEKVEEFFDRFCS